MELFALTSTLPGLIRPEMALQHDLSAVLREGQVLQGEVLQTMDGGALLIGIGSHRVPARSQVELQPGERFLFQVEQEGDGIVLRVLGGREVAESPLLRALRAVLGQDLPLGTVLGRLRAALLAGVPAGPEAASDGAGGLLVEQLDEHVFRPGASGSELRDQLQAGGLLYEARLRETALQRLPASELRQLGRDLASGFFAALEPGSEAGAGTGSADGSRLAPELRRALLELLGPAGDDAEALGRIHGRELERLLERALGRVLEGADLRHARAALSGFDVPAAGAGARRILLAALLGWDPVELVGGPASRLRPPEVGELDRDLKARLLRALAASPEGPQREAVAKALSGLEAEQLLNLARRESHEPLHWSLPVPDGDRWTTAHLLVRRDGERPRAPGGEEEEGQRLTLSVEFTHTGPVRADLALRAHSTALRILVARPEVRDRARAALGELEQALALGGRTVHVAVDLAPPGSLAVNEDLQDIRYLREHPLMDLRG